MTWLRGRIKRFHPPSDKKKAERVKRYRKIQTSKGQTFGDMHFFKVSQAIQAGYAEASLDEGCEIYFEPIVRGGQKQVARFKPPEGQARRQGS